MMDKITQSRMQPIRDVIYKTIRKAILRGDFLPGERLMEEQLAQELGTSRTPVREALRKLEVEKMVSHLPHKGVVVSSISSDELEDLYEIRALIETIIAKQAAINATPRDIENLRSILDKEEAATDPDIIMEYIEEYNFTLAEIANCPQISNLARQVRETLARMIKTSHLHPTRRQKAQIEHRAIVDAIADGNSELAQKLTIDHIKNSSNKAKAEQDNLPK